MIGLEFLRHGDRFAAQVRRRYFSAERISTAGNTSAFAGITEIRVLTFRASPLRQAAKLETSALESLYGGQFTFILVIDFVDKPRHSFQIKHELFSTPDFPLK